MVIYLVNSEGGVTGPIKVGTIIANFEEPEPEPEPNPEPEPEPNPVTPVVLLDGSGSISVSHCYFGGKYDVKVSSNTNDASKASVRFKQSSTGTYLNSAPTEIGSYIAEATFPANDKYKAYTATTSFTIDYLPAPAKAYTLDGTKGENGFYVSDVKVTAPEGYLISTALLGEYTDSITVSASSVSVRIYLKKVDTGEMTDAVAVQTIKLDKINPEVTGVESGKEYYSDDHTITVEDENLTKVTLNGEEMELVGGKCTINLNPDGDAVEYTLITVDMAGNTTTTVFTIASEWLKNKVIISGKFIVLKAGSEYELPEGDWKLVLDDGSVDPTVYKGGCKIKVNSDTKLKFSN